MVKPAQVIDGATLYIENEVLPVLKGWQLWAASAALALVYQRAEMILGEVLKDRTIIALGIADAEGNIDVDAAITALKDTAKKRGKLELDTPFAKLKFGEADFDKLKAYIDESRS